MPKLAWLILGLVIGLSPSVFLPPVKTYLDMIFGVK